MLSRREYSRYELKQKLSQKFSDQGAVDTALDSLVENNYLSDHRFAVSFIRAKLQRGKGINLILQELKNKGIEPQLANAVLEELNIDWLLLASKVFRKKFSNSLETVKDKARGQRFMLSRGFSVDHFKHLL